MKKINLTEEQHEKLKSYSFFNKMTMKDALTNAIDLLLVHPPVTKVVNTTSSKVVNTPKVKVIENISTLNCLDWTDKEAQNLIDPSILQKFGI